MHLRDLVTHICNLGSLEAEAGFPRAGGRQTLDRLKYISPPPHSNLSVNVAEVSVTLSRFLLQISKPESVSSGFLCRRIPDQQNSFGGGYCFKTELALSLLPF